MAADAPVPTESVSEPTRSDAHLVIKQLEFSGGETVDVERDAVIAIVSPNNSGKTRALAGISDSCNNANASVQVCKGVFERRGSLDQLRARLTQYEMSGHHWRGPNFDFNNHQLNQWKNNPAALGPRRIEH